MKVAGGKVQAPEVAVARMEDIPAISTFILEAWKVAGPSSWGWAGASDENVKVLASSRHLAKILTSPKTAIHLARLEGRVVGFAATREMSQGTAELAGIIVDERFTGQGVGTSLAKASIAWAADQQFKEILVKTETYNERAIGFYEANKFVQTSVVTEDVEGKVYSLVVLRRKLAGRSGRRQVNRKRRRPVVAQPGLRH